MKFSKRTLSESLNRPLTGKKVFTEGKKQNVVISEEQLDRLILQLNESTEKIVNKLVKESYELIREAITNENLDLNSDDYTYALTEQGMYDRNPGIAAAEGVENIINGIKKAYDMIKDSDTRKKLANSITKLGNFMTYTAELVGSGSSQRAPRSYDQLANPLPHPEFEKGEHHEGNIPAGYNPEAGVNEQQKASEETPITVYLPEIQICWDKKNDVQIDCKGGEKEDTAIHATLDEIEICWDKEKNVRIYCETKKPITETTKVIKKDAIKEDIKKMKQIIKPIKKI